MKKHTHDDLTIKAVKWLKRNPSAGGPGCHFAISEMSTGSGQEIPDAFGVRASGDDYDGSVLVEVKVSRADFLQDKKKPHRNGEKLGIGRWRYYMCPEGLIKPDELPKNWGLLYVTPRGGVKPIVGAASEIYYGPQRDALKAMQFEVDAVREQYLLTKLLSRVANPEDTNKLIKKARSETSDALKMAAQRKEDVKALADEISEIQTENEGYRQKLGLPKSKRASSAIRRLRADRC